jgi:hypothetical protein
MSDALVVHIAEKCCMSTTAVEDLIDRDLIYEDASGVVRVAGTGIVVYGQGSFTTGVVGVTVTLLEDPRYAPLRI